MPFGDLYNLWDTPVVVSMIEMIVIIIIMIVKIIIVGEPEMLTFSCCLFKASNPQPPFPLIGQTSGGL